MTSPRLSFYASSTRTRQQIIDAREDTAHWRRQDIIRAFDRSSLVPKPLDDEPQEHDQLGNDIDAGRDRWEETSYAK